MYQRNTLRGLTLFNDRKSVSLTLFLTSTTTDVTMLLVWLCLTCLCVCRSTFGHLRVGNQGGNAISIDEFSKEGLGLDNINQPSTHTNTNLPHPNHQHFSPLHRRLQSMGDRDRGLQGDAYPSYPSYELCPRGEMVLDVWFDFSTFDSFQLNYPISGTPSSPVKPSIPSPLGFPGGYSYSGIQPFDLLGYHDNKMTGSPIVVGYGKDSCFGRIVGTNRWDFCAESMVLTYLDDGSSLSYTGMPWITVKNDTPFLDPNFAMTNIDPRATAVTGRFRGKCVITWTIWHNQAAFPNCCNPTGCTTCGAHYQIVLNDC